MRTSKILVVLKWEYIMSVSWFSCTVPKECHHLLSVSDLWDPVNTVAIFFEHVMDLGNIAEPCQNSRKIYWARHGFKGLVHSRGRSLAVRKKTDTCDQEHRTFSATAQQTCYYYFLIPLESQLQSYIISTTKHILNWITDTDWIVTKLHSFII